MDESKVRRVKSSQIEDCQCWDAPPYGPHSSELSDILVFPRLSYSNQPPFRPCTAHAHWYRDFNTKRILKTVKVSQ